MDNGRRGPRSIRPARGPVRLAFLIWTRIQLQYQGTVDLLKECNRKLGWFSSSKKLDWEKDLPSRLDGFQIIITGGARGIGAELIKLFISRGANVIATSSGDPSKFDQLSAQLKVDAIKEYGGHDFGKVEFWSLDLTSMQSVLDFADRFLALQRPLNILINNAGIMFAPFSMTTDGFESHLSVNYLGHCLLTLKLLPVLNSTGLQGPFKSRIVNLSSSAHCLAKLWLEDLNCEWIYSPYHAYNQSKLAMIMFTYKLHDLLINNQLLLDNGPDGRQVGVYANCLHPGVVPTDLFQHDKTVRFFTQLGKPLLKTVKEGAETPLYAALCPELEQVGGKYLVDCEITSSSKYSLVCDTQDKLWDKTIQLLRPWLNDVPQLRL